jgi:CBS domain-containing protein
MRVRQVMTSAVARVRPDEQLGKVARLLSRQDVRCVAVVDATGRVLGAMDCGDVCTAMASRRGDPRTWVAGDVMHRAASVPAHAPVENAYDRLRRARTRQLLVLDEQEQAVGLLSFDELGHHAAQELRFDCSAFRAKQFVQTLADALYPPPGESATS